jgi:hypothetical protein
MNNEWSEFYCINNIYVESNDVVRIKPNTYSDGGCYSVDFEIFKFYSGEFAKEFEGIIKFDGCCDWSHDHDISMHLCGINSLDDIKNIFKVAYALAHDAMPTSVNFERPEIDFIEAPMIYGLVK